MSFTKYITLAIALCTVLMVSTANRAAAAALPAALGAIERASKAVATSDVIKVGNRRAARRAARRAQRARRGEGRRARRAGRRARRADRRSRRHARRHARRGDRRYHRRHKRRRARVHIGFYPYYYPYYYGGYAPYYYGTPTYYTPRRRYRRGGCGYWKRQCRANWGYRNSDYYGCMRYHGCR